MDRRKVLKLAGLGATVLTFPTMGEVMRLRAHASGNIGFHFAAVSAVAGTNDRLSFTGGGEFGGGNANGEGGFTHWLAGTGTPPSIVGTGVWKVTSFDGFADSGSFGVLKAGVLNIDVHLESTAGTEVDAEMEVVCNIGAAGLFTGKPEGVKLTIVGGPTFSPVGGTTLFNGDID